MKKALLPILALILAVGLALPVVRPVAAHDPAATIQLVVLLDASSSIQSNEWSTQLDGLAAAINDPSCIPHDGSVELTVITFYTTRHWDWGRRYTTHTPVEIDHVVIDSEGTANSVADDVQDISRPWASKYTPLASAIDAATEQLTGENGARRIINICTDGDPNINRAGTARVSEANAKYDAVEARNDAIGAGIDEISAEAIGDISGADIDWLSASIVWPQPGYIAPPFTPGWVYEVGTSADNFKVAICHKCHKVGYTLMVESNGCCSISVDTDTHHLGDVSPGDTGTFNAIPYGTVIDLAADDSDVCCEFVNWTGDMDDSGSTITTTVTMDDDKSVTAHCITPGPFTLTTNADPTEGGSVTGGGTYDCGTSVQLNASADSGWSFSGWSGDLTGSINPDFITMDGDKTVTATFTEDGSTPPPPPQCFIATAAYGSNLDGHVDTLRAFRDQYLVTNPVGSSFVSLYYKTSPPIAEFIDDHPALKPMVRAALLPAVALSIVAINTTAAQMVAMDGGIALVSIILAMWLRQRSRRLGSADKRL